MDTEFFIEQMEKDFEMLAEQHFAEAAQERLLARAATDVVTACMHTKNMELHNQLARMYDRMKDDGLAFCETYDDDSKF